MASVIVVDNALKDSISDYAKVIDSIVGSDKFSKDLGSMISSDSNEVSSKSELLDAIYGSSVASNLSNLTDKEFESTFNLIIHIAVSLEKSVDVISTENSEIIKNLLDCNPDKQPSLRDRKSIKSTTILSVLTTIFNLLPQNSSNRVFVLSKVLDVVEKSGIDFSLIQDNIGNNINSWLIAAGAPEQEIRTLFWKFISLDNSGSKKTLELIKKFTSTYNLSEAEFEKLALFALSSSVVDISFMINTNVGAALNENSGSEISNLFYNYAKGNLITAVPLSVSDELGLSIKNKSKILALAKFFSEDEKKDVYSYSEIPNGLASDPQEFELLLINSIKAGVIEGKLNQVEENFTLTRVNTFILAGDSENINKSWEGVRRVLIEWKSALENIDDIVKTSKENIVNNNSN